MFHQGINAFSEQAFFPFCVNKNQEARKRLRVAYLTDFHLCRINHGANENQLVFILKIAAASESPIAFLDFRRTSAGQILLQMLHRLLHFNVKIAGKKMWKPSGFCLILTTMSSEPTEKKKVVSSSTMVVIFFGKQHSFLPFLGNPLLLLQMLSALFKSFDDRR